VTKPSYTSNQIAPTESASDYATRMNTPFSPPPWDPEDDPTGWCDECDGFGSHLFGCPNGNGSEPS
jgi:hypothetical protein